MMVFYYSFPSPESSQASVIPIIVVYLSVQPFFIILLCRFLYRTCCKPKTKLVHNHNTSDDTLSKATPHLSENEEEPLNDTSQTKNVSIPSTELDPKQSIEV